MYFLVSKISELIEESFQYYSNYLSQLKVKLHREFHIMTSVELHQSVSPPVG